MRTLIKKVMVKYPEYGVHELSELLEISLSTYYNIMSNTRGNQKSLKVKRTNTKLKERINELLK